MAWQLINDPAGPSPPMGSAEFGPLPPDMEDQPIDMFGDVFPPRPPRQPIASIVDTGALAGDHVRALQEHIAKAEMEEPPLPPMAEAVGASDVAMTGEPQPMAEA
eukprot:14113013-Alexandrium_andersonii.AAC.1